MLSLRWRLDYADRASRFGRWNDLDPPMELMSSYAPKDGISDATIEAKLADGTIKKVVHAPGAEWEAFQVLCAASMPGFFKGTVTPLHRFVGLVLYTNDEKAFFLVNGKAWKEARNDKNIVFEGWRN